MICMKKAVNTSFAHILWLKSIISCDFLRLICLFSCCWTVSVVFCCCFRCCCDNSKSFGHRSWQLFCFFNFILDRGWVNLFSFDFVFCGFGDGDFAFNGGCFSNYGFIFWIQCFRTFYGGVIFLLEICTGSVRRNMRTVDRLNWVRRRKLL